MKKELSRRSFIGGAAGALAVGGIMGLAGCAPSSGSAAPVDEPQEKTFDITETIDADVCVIGGGNSGMAATVEAAELGAKTVLLEKMELGGNGAYTFGPAGWNDEISQAAGVEYDWHEAVPEELKIFNYRQNSRFFMDMAQESPNYIRWCLDHGVKFCTTVDNYKGGHPTMHYFTDKDGDTGYDENGMRSPSKGYAYINAMAAAAEAAGVQILTKTPAVKILKDGDKVSGVVAQREDGTYIQVNAKSVIVATGGFQANPDMRLKYGRGDELTSFYCGVPGMDGDGIRMATEAGALDTTYMAGFVDQPFLSEMYTSAEWGVGSPTCPMLSDFHPLWAFLKVGMSIWVNERGERFTDEACGHPETGLATWGVESIVAQQKAFLLIDGAGAELFGQDNIDALMNNNLHNTKFQADTLEELAAAMGMDPETLKGTVSSYNDMCAAGVDTEFGKRADSLIPLGDGPYYAFRLCVFTMCSVGGIRINRDMQCCDADWNVIEGLYAVGMDSLPFYPSMYYFNMPGSGVAFEIYSGLTAARHAVSNL